MSRRGVIGAALAIALVVFAAALLAINVVLPPQSDIGDEGKDFGYVYSGPKSSSVDFTVPSMPDDSILLFGSSELSTPPSLVSQVPANVFGQHRYGVNTTFIGEAYDQSLWQAIAVGAYGSRIGNKKVALIVSPSWFFDGGLDDSLFQTRFSYSLYRDFMANPDISGKTKAYVRSRAEEQGLNAPMAGAGTGESLIDKCNDVFYAALDDLKLRADLTGVRSKGFAHESGGDAVPPFDEMRERARAEAQEKSASNKWGFDDASYASNVGDALEQIKGRLSGETFSQTAEYDDFACFLDVCNEAGLETLVIVSPLSGDYYDWVGVEAAARRSCYERIIEIAEEHEAQVADFSDREYERYFLHDMVHFGWTGWVDVEKAIYDFALGD